MGRPVGYKHSKETKDKMSKSKKGKRPICAGWNRRLKGFVNSGSFQKNHKQLNTGRTWIKNGQFSKEKHPNWKGGKYYSKYSGYVFVLCPEHPFADTRGYIREHRLVVEKYLGRYLDKNEVVHHINGIKNDNELKNLYLFTSSEHKTFHKKKLKPILKSSIIIQ
jgi:hypothetical protein